MCLVGPQKASGPTRAGRARWAEKSGGPWSSPAPPCPVRPPPSGPGARWQTGSRNARRRFRPRSGCSAVPCSGFPVRPGRRAVRRRGHRPACQSGRQMVGSAGRVGPLRHPAQRACGPRGPEKRDRVQSWEYSTVHREARAARRAPCGGAVARTRSVKCTPGRPLSMRVGGCAECTRNRFFRPCRVVRVPIVGQMGTMLFPAMPYQTTRACLHSQHGA